MTFLSLTIAASLGLLTLAGCGSGGGSSGGDASLNFQALWEQPAGGSALGSGAGVENGGFGSELPGSVQTVRVVFESESGTSCCVAVDPAAAQTNSSGQRVLLLKPLPDGPAAVTLAGFPTDFAPAVVDITDTCPTVPISLGQECNQARSQAPSFGSEPVSVVLIPGVDTDAGDIPVFALPFLVNDSLVPARNSTVASPARVEFIVASPIFEIDLDSVVVDTIQDTTGVRPLNADLIPCDDGGDLPCSDNRELNVAGFLVSAPPQSFVPGIARVRVRARNIASPPRGLAFDWQFFVGN